MLASHFGYVSLVQEMGMIVPERTAGVAPLRHEIELAQYRERQALDRELAHSAAVGDCLGVQSSPFGFMTEVPPIA
jgi:hypothetical protein